MTMTYEDDDDDGEEVRRAVATFDAINADKRAEENLERADATTPQAVGTRHGAYSRRNGEKGQGEAGGGERGETVKG